MLLENSKLNTAIFQSGLKRARERAWGKWGQGGHCGFGEHHLFCLFIGRWEIRMAARRHIMSHAALLAVFVLVGLRYGARSLYSTCQKESLLLSSQMKVALVFPPLCLNWWNHRKPGEKRERGENRKTKLGIVNCACVLKRQPQTVQWWSSPPAV